MNCIRSGESYSKRELGYLSEFLFKVWIEYNNVTHIVVPVVNTEDRYAVCGVMNLLDLFKFVLYKLIKQMTCRK